MPLVNAPATRAEFKEYCLRKLGKGAIEINVTDEQVDDRINDALLWWWDYHFEGAEKTYYKYQFTDTDADNGYITLPENIIGAVRIFDASDAYNTDNMFSIRYQIALNDLYTLVGYSMIPYYMARMGLELMEQILVGSVPIRYTRYNDNKLYIDQDWNRMGTSNWIVVEAYMVVDPDVCVQAYQDRWLGRYATALIKQQWGNNMKKFTGMQLPGGVQMSGQTIYDEATNELAAIEQDVIHSYSIPVTDMIG